jgi:hypothetical protein
MVLEQSVADSLGYEAADVAFAMEADFAFGGVDIDVDGGGIDLEKEAADGVTAFHQAGVVAFQEGKIEAAIFDGPPVYEQVLVLAGRARDSRGANKTPKPKGRGAWLLRLHRCRFVRLRSAGHCRRGCEVDGQQLVIGAIEGAQPFAQSGQATGLIGSCFNRR